MNRWLALGWLLVLALALLGRLPRLDQRPMHNDEAINAKIVQGLWEKGDYKYNPDEYHGPSLYYFSLPFLSLSGARDMRGVQETTLRLVPVFFGVLLVLSLGLLTLDGSWSRPAGLLAGLFAAVSPAANFYSRYYIHEILLACFAVWLLWGGWQYFRTNCLRSALLAGAALGLMYATKETFVLTLGAMGLAGIVLACWPGSNKLTWGQFRLWVKARGVTLSAALIMAAAVGVLLITSFFSNPAGLWDSVRTYLPWGERAGGHSPHVHPWYFYLQRLLFFHPPRSPIWSEGLVFVLAVIGSFAAFLEAGLRDTNRLLARFVALSSWILLGAYCLIPYKTPWCLLEFWPGFILLAGVGGTFLWRVAPGRWARGIVLAGLLAGIAHLGWQSWRANYVFPADPRNPYVYAQTSPNLVELIDKVEAISALHPDGKRMVIKVITDRSPWPLPWYLRGFERVGFYEKLPADPYAPIMIVSYSLGAALDEKSEKKWLSVQLSEIRPREYVELYVNFDLWKRYVETLPPPKDE